MTKITKNEAIIKAFAEQFDPPMTYVRTLRVNNVPFADAWQVSYWDNAKAIGITAVAFEGQLHAFIEAAGRGDIAAAAGKAMAIALDRLKPDTETAA
jgi:hypothetical protein